jgi:hypothetical protein
MSIQDCATAAANTFPSSIQEIMVEIAGAESSWVNNCPGDFGLTDGPQASDGSTSWGLWQINSINSDILQNFTGSSDPDTWQQWCYDPNNNAQAALQIYNNPQGLGNWSTYTSGAYLNFTTDAQNALSGCPTTNLTSNNAFTGTGTENITLPTTNYNIVAGTQAQGDVLYGRKYRVLILNPNGPAITGTAGGSAITQAAGADTATAGQSLTSQITPTTALDVSQLHCVFSCVSTMMIQPLWSICTIYNLSPETENTIIMEGFQIIIEAGYEGSQYGQIYQGNIVQCIRDKPDGATYTLTLVSMDAQEFQTYGTVIGTLTRGANSRAQIGYVASACSVPTPIGKLTPDLSTTGLTRGKVFFGMASDYLRQIAQSENATYYLEDGNVNIVKVTDLPTDEVIDLTPNTGLIGVPAQSEYGATIKMLMNPKVKIGTMVHVNNSLIRNEQYAQGQAIYALDNDGLYRAIKKTFTGDTRGTDWYTEIETVTQTGIAPSMITSGGQSPY